MDILGCLIAQRFCFLNENLPIWIRPVSQEKLCPKRVTNSDNKRQIKRSTYFHYTHPPKHLILFPINLCWAVMKTTCIFVCSENGDFIHNCSSGIYFCQLLAFSPLTVYIQNTLEVWGILFLFIYFSRGVNAYKKKEIMIPTYELTAHLDLVKFHGAKEVTSLVWAISPCWVSMVCCKQ